MRSAEVKSAGGKLAEGSGVSSPDPSFLLTEKPKRRKSKGGKSKGGKRHGTGGGAFLAKVASWVFSSNAIATNLPESFKKYSGVI